VLEGDGFRVACRLEPLTATRRNAVFDAIRAAAETGQVCGAPMLWRGPIGLRPLYRSRSKSSVLFSTDWRELPGTPSGVKPVPPGSLFDGGPLKNVASLDTMQYATGGPLNMTTELDRTIRSAVKTRTAGRFALLFSGGLDSALLASYLPRCPLLAVGLNGASDLKTAREAAMLLDREDDLVEVRLSPDEVKSLAGDVARLAYSPSRMDLELGTVMLAAFRECLDTGLTELFSGHGADELFGGYARYEYLASSGDTGAAGSEMFRDLLGIWRGLDRNHALARTAGVDVCYPYLDREVVRLALSIPPERKVVGSTEAGKEYIRKFPLREVACRRLPEKLALQPKRAMQYGSGVHRVISRLAKRGYLRGDGK